MSDNLTDDQRANATAVVQAVDALMGRAEADTPPTLAEMSAEERIAAARRGYQDLATRLANQALVADAAAAQVDASPVEVRNAERLRRMLDLARQAADDA